MTVQPFTFGIESRPGEFGPDAGARIINGYTEIAPREADVPYFTRARPGLKAFTGQLEGAGGFRGGIRLGSAAYVVIGPVIWKVDATGFAEVIGGFLGSAPVRMVRNQKATPQIAMVSEGVRNIIENDMLIGLTDTDLPAPIDVTELAGYTIYIIPDGRYFYSGINEASSIDALDFASAEARADGLVAGQVRNQELILYGETSIEFHGLTGNSNNPFMRVPNTTVQFGCLSGPAVQEINGVHIFPAADGTVRKLAGYVPERISNHDVERDIDELEDKSSMRAMAFSLRGHQFYVLSSPSWSWACDLTNSFWYEWNTHGHNRWKAEGYVELGDHPNQLRIVGDYQNPFLYQLDPATYDDAGDHIIWKMVGRLTAPPNRIELNDFYANLIPGVGLNSTDPHLSDPKAMMRVSKDNGTTWGNEKQRSVGKIGEKKKRTQFGRFGTSKEDGFLVELSMSAAVARSCTGAAADTQLVKP